MSFKYLSSLLVIACLLKLGCATPEVSEPNNPANTKQESVTPSQTLTDLPENPISTTVDISYVLERSSFRLSFSSNSDSALGKAYTEKALIKTADLNRSKYLSFLKKAFDLAKTVTKSQQSPESALPSGTGPCRGAYTVKIKANQSQILARGCRSNDSGLFSRLVNEAEFLLHSEVATKK